MLKRLLSKLLDKLYLYINTKESKADNKLFDHVYKELMSSKDTPSGIHEVIKKKK